MRGIRRILTASVLSLGIGLFGCTVYVVPAEENGRTSQDVAQEEDSAAAAAAEREARAAEERAARDAEERAAREAAERAAREAAEREARQRAERRAEERQAREVAAREAAEREARRAAAREARRREAREAEERAAREAAAREARERAAREAAERRSEAAREARERAERRAAAREAERASREAARRRAEEAREARRLARAGSRDLHVPPGHLPPEGQCRVWVEGRPPGRQAPPTACDRLTAVPLQAGTFILYGGDAWDITHDWRTAESDHPGAVPSVVLRIVETAVEVEETEVVESREGRGEHSGAGPGGPPEERGGRGNADAPEGRSDGAEEENGGREGREAEAGTAGEGDVDEVLESNSPGGRGNPQARGGSRRPR